MGDIRSSEKSFLLFEKNFYLSYYSLRRDIYTVLRYRSVFKSPIKRLHPFSFIMELCILSLILLNVVLAIADASNIIKSNDSCGSRNRTFMSVCPTHILLQRFYQIGTKYSYSFPPPSSHSITFYEYGRV